MGPVAVGTVSSAGQACTLGRARAALKAAAAGISKREEDGAQKKCVVHGA
jgi:hypothetical protein